MIKHARKRRWIKRTMKCLTCAHTLNMVANKGRCKARTGLFVGQCRHYTQKVAPVALQDVTTRHRANSVEHDAITKEATELNRGYFSRY